MYDLGSGTEDIVVKDAKIVGTNGLKILKDNNPNTYHEVSIESTNSGFEVKVDGNSYFRFDDIRPQGKVIFALVLWNVSSVARPLNPDEGAVIYDSTLKKCILWNGTAWVNLDGTALS